MQWSSLDVGRHVFRQHYLALNVDIVWRHTDAYAGPLVHAQHQFRMVGRIPELIIQVLVRPLTPWGEVAEYVDLHQLGDPDGPWPLERFRPAPGVELGTVMRLRELSDMYNRNLRAHTSAEAPTRAVFIPRGVLQEIRDIARRLRR